MKRSPIRNRRTKPRPGRLQGEALHALRGQCWHRDGGVCQECLKVTNPELHYMHPDAYHMAHIQAKRRGGDSIENVRTLCSVCHFAEHSPKAVPRKPKIEEYAADIALDPDMIGGTR